jgi:hypothetical protein
MGKNMIFSPDSGGFPPFADPQKPFGFAAEIIPGSRRGLFFLSHLKRDVSVKSSKKNISIEMHLYP